MKTMRRTGIQLMLAIVWVAAVRPQVTDAQCITTWKDFRDAKEHSAFVFSGTVTEIEPGFVFFEVDRVWKGSVLRQFILPVRPSSIETVYKFQEGEAYLVFVVPNREFFQTNPPPRNPRYESMCGATRPLSEAQMALAQLEEGSKPK